MNTIDQRYADLLAEDPELDRLIEGLDRAYSAETPTGLRDTIHVMAAGGVSTQQQGRIGPLRLARFGSRRRLTVLGGMALAAALLTGAVAADIGPVEWAMSQLTGTGQ